MIMRQKVIFILKVIVAVCTAVLGVLGVSAVVSCSVKRSVGVDSNGIGVFHYVDTIRVNRSTTLDYPKK